MGPHSNFVFLSGSANENLSKNIARELDTKLGKLEIVTFADSEKRVRIEENVTGKKVFVIASLSNPVDSHLIELCLIGDALKANDAAKTIAVIPYYGYARQDKAHREGEGVSARVTARLIEAIEFNRVITVDLHSEIIVGYHNIPVNHLFGAQVFIDILKQNGDKYVVVAPDAGGAKRAQKFAELLEAPLILVQKKRNLDKLHTLDAIEVIGRARGKTAVMIDDIITSGSTLVKAAYALKEQGAKKVIACATHPDFIDGTKKILENSPLDAVYVTDTIRVKTEDRFKQLKILSLAPFLAREIGKLIS